MIFKVSSSPNHSAILIYLKSELMGVWLRICIFENLQVGLLFSSQFCSPKQQFCLVDFVVLSLVCF